MKPCLIKLDSTEALSCKFAKYFRAPIPENVNQEYLSVKSNVRTNVNIDKMLGTSFSSSINFKF